MRDEIYTKDHLFNLAFTVILYFQVALCILIPYCQISGFKGKLRNKRKVQWNPESGLLGRYEFLSLNKFNAYAISISHLLMDP